MTDTLNLSKSSPLIKIKISESLTHRASQVHRRSPINAERNGKEEKKCSLNEQQAHQSVAQIKTLKSQVCISSKRQKTEVQKGCQ